MVDQGGPIDVGVVIGDDSDQALYRTGPDRQESLAFSLVPHGVRYAINNPGDPVGDEQRVISNAVVSLVVADQAISAILQCQDQPIRYTLSGTAPTAAIGFRAAPGDVIVLGGIPAMKMIRFIREGAVDGSLAVLYFD